MILRLRIWWAELRFAAAQRALARAFLDQALADLSEAARA